MICEFCGSTIDDTELECPYCGHKTNVEPQVAVYDYEEPVEEKPIESAEYETEHQNYSDVDNYQYQEQESEEEPVDEEEYEEKITHGKTKFGIKMPSFSGSSKSSSSSNASHSKNLGEMPKLALMGASCILSLICLFSLISVNKKISSMEQTMLSQFYQLQSATNDISNSVSGLNGAIDTVSSSIDASNESKYITITHQPTSATTYLGRGGEDDSAQNVIIFNASATGSNLSVKWQIKVNNDWVDIVWDENDNNLTYGLHLYTDTVSSSSEASTQLCAHGLTQSAFNQSYRCVFVDAYGTKATDPVTITEKSAE